MNLYNVRIKHLGTGIVYIHSVIAKNVSEAMEKANQCLTYSAIDAKLIRTNV